MKAVSIIIVVLLTQFGAMSQDNENRWEKNVKVKLHDPLLDKFISGNVKYRINKKVFSAKEVEGGYMLFDSIPFGEGTIEIVSGGYESQTYNMSLLGNNIYNFYLGERGSAYYPRDGVKFPYQKHSGVYGLIVDFNQIDSVELFLKEKGVEVQKKKERYNVVQIKSSEVKNSASFIFDLIEHPGISDAGEVYAQNMISGIFTTQITIKFNGLTNEEINKIIESHGLDVKSKSGTTYRCKITRASNGTTIEVANRLQKIAGVVYASVHIADIVPPRTLQH